MVASPFCSTLVTEAKLCRTAGERLVLQRMRRPPLLRLISAGVPSQMTRPLLMTMMRSARAAVVSLEVGRHVGPDLPDGCAILRMVVQQMTPAVRPEDILTALGQFSAPAPTSPPVVTRLWQGSLASAATSTGMAAHTGAIG